MILNLIIILRKFLRITKLNKLIALFINLFRSSDYYENKFKTNMLNLINKNYCIWDVGANRGLYTKLFSKDLDNDGYVYAFEPSKNNLLFLKENLKEEVNIEIVPYGLNEKNRKVSMYQGSDQNGATSKIVSNNIINNDKNQLFEIETFSGDYLIEQKGFKAPNFIKIDVEGYEYEVVAGLSNQLKDNILKIICIEMHFEEVAKRGFPNHPSLIVRMLQKHNFEVKWTDYSHIIASKI